MYEHKQNTGTLFRNDRATKDSDPTHKGDAIIDGRPMWISAWVNEAGPNAKNPGSKFFSLRFEPKVQKGTQIGDEGHARPYGAATTTREGSAQGGKAQGPSGGSQGPSGWADDLPF